ncbi:hypothetical protein DFH09DRAFT_1112741 [Mycena vulgaris]|nr:hypothetical protein DFH09DRAFT_1112741 [Mycena vulgaris]
MSLNIHHFHNLLSINNLLIQLRTASHKDLVKAQNSTYGCLISLVKEPRCDFKTLPEIYIQLLDAHKKLLSSYTGLPFRVSLSSAVESLPHNTHVAWIEANQRFKLSVGSYYYPQAFLIPADVPEPQTLLTALAPLPDAGCRLAKKVQQSSKISFKPEAWVSSANSAQNRQAQNNPSMMSDRNSDAAEEVTRIFKIPDQNATIDELREASSPVLHKALKNQQRFVNKVLNENKELRAQVAKYEASKPGRKAKESTGSLRGEDRDGYFSKIIVLGKSFSTMVDPWTGIAIFDKQVATPLAQPKDIFKPDSALYFQYLTASLYDWVPGKFHHLVDATEYSDFGFNRSQAIIRIKECLPNILLQENVIASAEAVQYQRLLLFAGDDPKVLKIAKFPPIIYAELKSNPTALFMNRIPPLVLRAILFGKASLGDNGKQKPIGSLVGIMWNVKAVTEGSMAFACTIMKAGSPGYSHIIKFWQKIVFHGVTIPGPVDADPTAEADSNEEMADALEGMDIEEVEGFQFGDETEEELAPASPPRPVPEAPPAARPIARPVARPTGQAVDQPAPANDGDGGDLESLDDSLSASVPIRRPASGQRRVQFKKPTSSSSELTSLDGSGDDSPVKALSSRVNAKSGRDASSKAKSKSKALAADETVADTEASPPRTRRSRKKT